MKIKLTILLTTTTVPPMRQYGNSISLEGDDLIAITYDLKRQIPRADRSLFQWAYSQFIDQWYGIPEENGVRIRKYLSNDGKYQCALKAYKETQ